MHMMKIQNSTLLKEEVNITILSLNNTPLIDPLLVLPTASAGWPRRRCSQLILTAADQHTGDYLAARPAALLIIGISFVLMVRWSGIICEALHNINQWPRRNIYISSETNKQAQWHSAVHHSASAFHYSTSRFIYINTALPCCFVTLKRREDNIFTFLTSGSISKHFSFL